MSELSIKFGLSDSLTNCLNSILLRGSGSTGSLSSEHDPRTIKAAIDPNKINCFFMAEKFKLNTCCVFSKVGVIASDLIIVAAQKTLRKHGKSKLPQTIGPGISQRVRSLTLRLIPLVGGAAL